MKHLISLTLAIVAAPLVAAWFGFLAKVITLGFNLGWNIL